jgi:acid phosphatase/phospholipase C
MKTKLLSTASVCVVAAAIACSIPVLAGQDDHDGDRDHRHPHEMHTETPIKHLVIIFNENRSFDHYFATYPNAGNPSGSIPFVAKPHTPKVNNLASANLLVNNPNSTNPANGTGATDPFRLDRTQANTRSQNHSYTPEQQANDNGKADLFPKFTGRGTAGGVGAFGTNGQVMGYFDGNTVTALWNYAQNFAMSDNYYTDTYGPSTPGALEVISGQTNGVQNIVGTSSSVADSQGGLTLIGDTDPGNDQCSSTTSTILMAGKNIGDLLNAEHISWGSFMGGFDLTLKNANGTTGCGRSTFSSNVNGTHRGLHPAPRLVPVLHVDRQPDPCAAELGPCDRPYRCRGRQDRRSGQPRLRSRGFLRGGEGRPSACRLLHQDAGLSGWSSRQFRSARRAGGKCRADQLPPEAAGVAGDRCHRDV